MRDVQRRGVNEAAKLAGMSIRIALSLLAAVTRKGGYVINHYGRLSKFDIQRASVLEAAPDMPGCC
jgi:hypothetical protein